jgi:hypothetical protein
MVDALFESFKAHSPFWCAHQGLEHASTACLAVRGALSALLVPSVVLALRTTVCESMIHQIVVVDPERSGHRLDAARSYCLLGSDIVEACCRVGLASF